MRSARSPVVEHVIVLQRAGNDVQMVDGRDIWWHELIPNQAAEAELEETDAEDVIMIIYTSGTTGRPKGAVHTHCGFPVKAAQDMAFGTDVHRGGYHLLDDRYGLDDGAVAAIWRDTAWEPLSSSMMAHPTTRGQIVCGKWLSGSALTSWVCRLHWCEL